MHINIFSPTISGSTHAFSNGNLTYAIGIIGLVTHEFKGKKIK